MSWDNLQLYLMPALLVGFVGWRLVKFRQVKTRLPQMIKEGAIVVDVRTRKEYGAGARAGSINIPLDEMNRRSNELDNSKQIILCCASGTRSGMAMGVLRKNGFKSVINAGPWTNTLE